MPESDSLFLTDDTADAALDELLAGYFARLDAGEIVDREAFIAAHPGFADELTEYFETAAEIERMAGPVLPQAVAAVDVLYGRDVEDPTAVDDTHPGVATDDSVRLGVARVSRPVRGSDSGDAFAGDREGGWDEARVRAGRESRAPENAESNRPEPAGEDCVEETVPATVGAGSPASGIALPRQFGRYTVERSLGEGAMGAVFLAEDAGLGRKVAIKVAKTSPGDGIEVVERLYREARSAAGLSHRNICPVYDVGEVNGVYYLTMAWIAGRPLKDFVHPEHLQPERQVAAVVRKLALALDHAHRAGIVHRDLKPANIMIDADREPVIMDFGLARRIDLPADLRVTHSGMIVGTPAYMSPEQVESDRERIGPSSDIYSLGVILYELLTGDLPFKGSLASVLGQILSNEPPPPSLLRPDLDRMLEAICLKMMAKQPEDRYASMRDVAEALNEYLRASRTPGGLAGDSARLPAFDREDLGRPVGLAAQRSRLHEQQQRAEALIRLGRYDVALRILESMVAVDEPSLTAYTHWAERELPRVREALVAADVEHDEARAVPSGRYASELELVEPRRSFWYVVPVAAAGLVLVAWGIVALLNASGSGDGVRTEVNRPNEAPAESDDAARRTAADAAPRDRSVARESSAAAAGAVGPDAQRDERETQRFTAPDALTSIAVTPDGSAVMATCADGRVYIWSLENGEPSQPLEAGGADVRDLVVSADGQRIAAVVGDSVRIWNRDGRIAGIVPLDETPASIGLSADGSQVFAAFRSIGPRMRGPRGAAFGPDSISRGDVIARYDVVTGERRGGLSPLFGSLLGGTAAFSAGGERAAIASHIGRLTVVDLNTFTAPSPAPWAERPIGPAAFGMGEMVLSGNGRRLLTLGAVTSVWDATDGSYLRELRVQASHGTALSWDGQWLLTPTADSGIALWRIDGHSPVATFPGHLDRISGLAFVPGRKLAVSASLDKTLRVWQLPDAFVPSSAETEAEANQPRVPEYQRP